MKWATGYKAGGVSVRSEPFVPYGNENVNTLEVGFKSEFWDRRARLNTAIFFTDYKDMQIDFLHPTKISVVETINAQHTVEVDGVEMDFTAVLAEGLVLNVSYTYLDGDMPLQPNPLAGGVLTDFEVTQTPQHAGALAIDYTFRPWRFSTVTAHLDLTSTDQYAYAPLGAQRFDAYTLLNARLTLADFTLNNNTGTLTVSAWGKNLGDEDYVVLALPIGNPLQTVNQTFGDPRTAGIDIVYEF